MKPVLCLLALALPLLGCGGDEPTCKHPCDISSASGCPSITVTCSSGTRTVQQCSGPAGQSQGCCAETAAELSNPCG